MADAELAETDLVQRLLRRRPPAAALRWAAAPFGPGSRVVAVRPLSSAWLANHAVDVADPARRPSWSRPTPTPPPATCRPC